PESATAFSRSERLALLSSYLTRSSPLERSAVADWTPFTALTLASVLPGHFSHFQPLTLMVSVLSAARAALLKPRTTAKRRFFMDSSRIPAIAPGGRRVNLTGSRGCCGSLDGTAPAARACAHEIVHRAHGVGGAALLHPRTSQTQVGKPHWNRGLQPLSQVRRSEDLAARRLPRGGQRRAWKGRAGLHRSE